MSDKRIMTICRKIQQQKTLLLTFPPSLLPQLHPFLLCSSMLFLPFNNPPPIIILPLFHPLIPFLPILFFLYYSFASSVLLPFLPATLPSVLPHPLPSLPFPLSLHPHPLLLSFLLSFPLWSSFPLPPSKLFLSFPSFCASASVPLLPFPSFSSCPSPVGPLPCHPPENSFSPLPSKTSSGPSLPHLPRHWVHPSFLSSLPP